MIKTFTIKKIEENQKNYNKSNITFHVMDENGSHREVKGTVLLNSTQARAGNIQSSSLRERPLLECLFTFRKNKNVYIEFSKFNRLHDRASDTLIDPISAEELSAQEDGALCRLSRYFTRAL